MFGLLTDRWGGRFALFTCLLMTPLLSALLALGSSYGWFFVAWLCLRFFQASGWIGLVKLAGGWVPYHRQGRVMGFLSLSMLAGNLRHTQKGSQPGWLSSGSLPSALLQATFWRVRCLQLS